MFDPLRRIARAALIAPIRFYKKHISPGLGHHCRFTPTCSEYAMQAIERHGCIKGLILSAWRILRCNPFGKWGYDPVPEKGRWKSDARVLHPARHKD
jgi:putative membrane protein insertion efficiency factor